MPRPRRKKPPRLQSRRRLKPATREPALLAQAPKRAAEGGSTSGKKPNIIFIMGDDIGWSNVGAYHRGIMAGRTPNLDKLAARE